VIPITVSSTVAASADDGYGNSTGGNFNTENGMAFYLTSTTVRGFARFVNLQIPQGATIVSASIGLSVKANFAVSCSLAAIAQDNAISAPASNTDVMNATLTSAAISWVDVATATKSPDIGAVIQEIVNRPGWQSGNAITLISYAGSQTGTGPEADKSETLTVTYVTDATQFSYTGAAQTWTAPADGIVQTVLNGAGANGLTAGGRTSCSFAVKKDDVLQINVGGTSTTVAGGWNGGGAGTTSAAGNVVLGAGGATDIRLNGTALSDRILIAGGSGSKGYCAFGSGNGGTGGGASGTAGANSGSAAGGAAGTQTTGYSLGSGQTPSWIYSSYWGDYIAGGAGGGGYYGGFSGGTYSTTSNLNAGGGGGGSGYIAATVNTYGTSGSTTQGAGSTGNGSAYLSFTAGTFNTVAITVVNSADDGVARTAGLDTTYGLAIGDTDTAAVGFARFASIPIPPGSIVYTATMSVTAWSPTSFAAVNTTIKAQASDNTLTPVSPTDIIGVSSTSANIAWQSTRTTGVQNFDLYAVIQEIVDRPGWKSGNAITILSLQHTTGNFAMGDKSETLNLNYFAPTPAGPTVVLWDGTTKLTGILYRWDGTTKIPITDAKLAP